MDEARDTVRAMRALPPHRSAFDRCALPSNGSGGGQRREVEFGKTATRASMSRDARKLIADHLNEFL